jgi:hypothetical protein
MSDGDNEKGQSRPPQTAAQREERAGNLGCGIGLLVAGGLLVANEAGWIKGVDWVVPAVVLGLAANYLYRAFSRG